MDEIIRLAARRHILVAERNSLLANSVLTWIDRDKLKELEERLDLIDVCICRFLDVEYNLDPLNEEFRTIIYSNHVESI